MQDWDKEADKAAEKTDAQLAAGIDKLITMDLMSAFPDPTDAKRVGELVKAIKSKTDKNERMAAFKAIGVTLGNDLFKLVQKAILGLTVALLAGTISAQAQSVTAIDLNAPLADARLGLAWDAQGMKLGVAQVPFLYWVSEDTGEEYATLNFGVSDKLSNGQTKMLVSAGPRIDTLFRKMAGSEFSKKHLRFAVLPPLQVSVILGTTDFHIYRPMISIITRFGGR